MIKDRRDDRRGKGMEVFNNGEIQRAKEKKYIYIHTYIRK